MKFLRGTEETNIFLKEGHNAGFFLDGPKKTQGEKNSKLKEKTQNSSLKPKKSALFEKFRMFLCEKLQVL